MECYRGIKQVNDAFVLTRLNSSEQSFLLLFGVILIPDSSECISTPLGHEKHCKCWQNQMSRCHLCNKQRPVESLILDIRVLVFKTDLLQMIFASGEVFLLIKKSLL